MTLPYPDSPAVSENIADSISRIEQNIEYLDGQIADTSFAQVVLASVEMSTAWATVNVAGAGFTPTAVMAWGIDETGESMTWGMATSTAATGCVYKTYAGTAGSDASLLLYLLQASGASQQAELQSFHSDGAYIEFTKTGSPVGKVMTINYIFMR